jgi:hypothetical protein
MKKIFPSGVYPDAGRVRAGLRSAVILFVLFVVLVFTGGPVGWLHALNAAILAVDWYGAGYAVGYALAWLISSPIEFIINLFS